MLLLGLEGLGLGLQWIRDSAPLSLWCTMSVESTYRMSLPRMLREVM